MDTRLFTIALREGCLEITFKKKPDADAFARMDFYSRLLHSLAPNESRVWQEVSRLDAEIIGWPRDWVWTRTSGAAFLGKRSSPFSQDELTQYAEILVEAMDGITLGERSATGVKLYRFRIRNGDDILTYRFHGKARTINALCVLFDLQSHPRNDLEVNIPRRLGIQAWPREERREIHRTYGDPSKTADELRNEGWTRMGDGPAMVVARENVGGQTQQTYTLQRVEQDLGTQMQRTNIPRRWKEALYQSQDNTCQICLEQYDPSLLEPDHRIPVIYEADQLTEENYLEKLMTLCRFCNQQKRETTKRLPADYDWQTSGWAFPERFDRAVIRRRLQSYKNRTGSSGEQMETFVRELLEGLD